MILLIDNYDSFTYNLAHLLAVAGCEVDVRRNDAIDPAEVSRLSPEGIVLSPGPGRPEAAGVTMDIIRMYGPTVPILGICLGHQAIGCAYGAVVRRHTEFVHGRASEVYHSGADIFQGVGSPFQAGRYHSLVIDRDTVPPCLQITAETADGTVMAVRHATHPVRGLQFHPESILTPCGRRVIESWLRLR